jgi:hypothetical protein
MQLQLLEAMLETMDARSGRFQRDYDFDNLPSNEGGSQVLTESLMWLTLLSRYDQHEHRGAYIHIQPRYIS